MRLEENTPVFRKAIIPWYDSVTACLIVIALMFLVCVFGAMGISAARETPEYNDFVWVPALLIILGGVVILSTALRLIMRYTFEGKTGT